MKRWITIIGLCALVIVGGAGCKSLGEAESIEVDTMFIDFEWKGKTNK